MTSNNVVLELAQEDELAAFRIDLQDAFAAGLAATFGTAPIERIPSDAELEEMFHGADALTYHVLLDGARVGGVVLTIDAVTHHNSLDLFFISASRHGRGIGLRAWSAVERMYPQTVVWETFTPYFDKRNIHFYVNKCGFKIVEFYSAHHPDPHRGARDGVPGGEAFRFEKVCSGSVGPLA